MVFFWYENITYFWICKTNDSKTSR
jgi:hypothetical protein